MAGELWRLEPHCCAGCFGRLLSREDGDARVYRCSNCGAEASGHRASVLCSCGIKLRTGKDAGIRCVAAADPTPECPSQIVAEQLATR